MKLASIAVAATLGACGPKGSPSPPTPTPAPDAAQAPAPIDAAPAVDLPPPDAAPREPVVIVPPEPPAPVYTAAPELDEAGEKLVAAARKATGAKALAAWAKVQTIDPDHSEARYGIAAAHIKLKDNAAAIAAFTALAASTRSDAIEFLVAARFDKTFAPIAGDQAFRDAVGLDRPPVQLYDKVMGHGGTWEQQGTSCDSPTVNLDLSQSRAFALKVRTVCSGQKFTSTFKGTWKLEANSVALVFPNKGAADEVVPCTMAPVGDEYSVACKVDDDLEFVVLPVRR